MNNSSSSVAVVTQQPNLGMQELPKLLPIAIAITLTNGLVFFMFYKRKSLRNSSNYLLLGLAVCDFLTGAVNIPYYLIFAFEVVPPTMYKDFAHWMYTLHTLVAVSAAYHILIITAEKYLAISQPLKYYLITKKTIFKVLVGIWVVSGFIAMIPLAWRKVQSNSRWYIIHSATCLVIVFLVPYAFMVYAYTVMFKAVSGRKRPSRHRNTVSDTKQLQKKNLSDRKCILVFATMAAIYLCCWLPYFTIMLVLHINLTKSAILAAEAFAIIRYITSITNPLLYTFFKRDFWLALRSLFIKRKRSFASRSTLRSFSLPYFTVKKVRSKSTDSIKLTRTSLTPESPLNGEFESNAQMNEDHTVFMSSV